MNFFCGAERSVNLSFFLFFFLLFWFYNKHHGLLKEPSNDEVEHTFSFAKDSQVIRGLGWVAVISRNHHKSPYFFCVCLRSPGIKTRRRANQTHPVALSLARMQAGESGWCTGCLGLVLSSMAPTTIAAT